MSDHRLIVDLARSPGSGFLRIIGNTQDVSRETPSVNGDPHKCFCEGQWCLTQYLLVHPNCLSDGPGGTAINDINLQLLSPASGVGDKVNNAIFHYRGTGWKFNVLV